MHPLLSIIKRQPDITGELERALIADDSYQCKAITFVNPFSYQLLRKDKQHFQYIDAIYSDGIVSCLLFKLFLRRSFPRVSFDYGSFAKTFFELTQEHQAPIFVIGTKDEYLEKAITQFLSEYPRLNICGYQDGYFTDEEAVINQVKDSGAQFVICGLGTPKQDIFAQKIKYQLSNQVRQVYTCGGFLHQSSQGIQYYPNWVNKFHLRWLYRAVNEPQVLKRLVFHYPKFIFKLVKDRFFEH